jgi:hypothetical protein
VKLNQLFGVTHGLGMGVITFDWGQIIGFHGSPLPTPWWSAANVGIALLIFTWFLVPVLYVSDMSFISFVIQCFVTTCPQYTNTWYSAFFPMVSSQVFDNKGNPYNVSRVINEDSTFNVDAYKAYSPLFISVTYAMAYGLSFAATTSTLTHTFIYYRKQIYNQARRTLADQPDIHARLMSAYKEVPGWWYLTIFCASIGERESARKCTNGIDSHYVWVRYRCHRNLALTVTCLGFYSRSRHRCGSEYPSGFYNSLTSSYIQHSRTRFQLVSLRLSRTG